MEVKSTITQKLLADIQARQPCVLVADDDEVVRYLLRVTLERLQCQVVEVESGDKVVPTIDSMGVDIVFLDLMFKHDPTGFEVMRKIRAENPALPVIIVTGCSADDLISLEGYIAILHKPFTEEDVRKVLRTHKLL